MEMVIRKAEDRDLDAIMVIYDRARRYMVSTGNRTQWGNGYPSEEIVWEDIREETCYVCEGKKGSIEAVFSVKSGADPTYEVIREGRWLNEEPYVTVHRLASAGRQHGIADICFRWMLERYSNIRADTHKENKTMQHLLEKNKFVRCGIILVRDGSERIAYQRLQPLV